MFVITYSMSILDYTISQLDKFNEVKFWLNASKKSLNDGDFVNCAIDLKRTEGFIKEIELFL